MGERRERAAGGSARAAHESKAEEGPSTHVDSRPTTEPFQCTPAAFAAQRAPVIDICLVVKLPLLFSHESMWVHGFTWVQVGACRTHLQACPPIHRLLLPLPPFTVGTEKAACSWAELFNNMIRSYS